MKIKRNKDGTISIKSKDGAAAIGIIGGSSDTEREKRYEQWVEDCARIVRPKTHTVKETEEYFLKLCEAIPLSQEDQHMEGFKHSVIMNHFRDKLKHKAADFSFDMTDEEIERWYEEDDAMHKEVRNSSTERFGLVMKGYYLPHTEINKAIYKEAYQEGQEFLKKSASRHHEADMPDIYFFLEETTGDFQSSGGGRSLMNELIAFRGISQEDIDNRTPRFLGYISALRELGKLPDFREK